MPYAIQLRDKPGHAQVRAETRAEHLDYLEANKDKLLAAGGLMDDDGSSVHGGIIIVDTDDRAEAEALIANDPFTRAGLFEEISVTRWRKAIFNFERLI